jgi:hypothetical protein
MMHRILTDRFYLLNGQPVPVAQIYEHCWGEDRISRLLIDWEAMEAWFGGARSAEQIRETALKFPEWFVNRLVAICALEPDAKVETCCCYVQPNKKTGPLHD